MTPAFPLTLTIPTAGAVGETGILQFLTLDPTQRTWATNALALHVTH
ncbi:MAG: hypothetical protein AAF628_38245 [Planctomycetota bacterium]